MAGVYWEVIGLCPGIDPPLRQYGIALKSALAEKAR